MIVYVVSKVVDQIDNSSTTTVSAHVDKFQADTAAQAIDHRGLSGVYGIVESVELDLTGLQSGQIFALENPV
jgi:hypothetical protein